MFNRTEPPMIINLKTMERENLLRHIAREFYRTHPLQVNHTFRILEEEELKPDPSKIVDIPGLEYLNSEDSYVNKIKKGYVVYVGRLTGDIDPLNCVGIEIKESK